MQVSEWPHVLLIGSGLFYSQVCGRVSFETLVGDWCPAVHRTALVPGGDSLLGALSSLQARLKAGHNCVLALLGRDRLGLVAPIG
jgi:hypothetical protein